MISKIAENIYVKHGIDCAKYQEEIELFQYKKLITLKNEKFDINNFILHTKSIKKTNRHLAFIQSLLLVNLSPNNGNLEFFSAQLAININFLKYAISTLESLRSQNAQSKVFYADILAVLARAYRDSFKFSEALSAFKEAYSIYNKIEDPLNEGWMLYAIGKMYLNYLEQPSRSIDYLRMAQKSFEGSDDKNRLRGISACIDELGDVYRQAFRDYEKAKKYYNEAINFNKQEHYYYELGLSRNYAHIGQCYEMLNNFSKAESYLKKSIELLNNNAGQEKGLGIRLTQLGNIQLKLSDYATAIETLKKGQEYNLKNKNFVKYLIFNDIYQGDYFQFSNKEQSVSKYKSAIESARKTQYFDLASLSYKKLSETYFSMRLYQESKLSMINSLISNIEHWENIKSDSPMLIEVSEKLEIGEMYQSLFYKLIDDYRLSYESAINVLNNVYEQLNFEQSENLNKMIKFTNIMSGIKHEIQNLHNDIIAVIDDVIDERVITSENSNLLKYLRGEIFLKTQVLSNSSITEIVSSIDMNIAEFSTVINGQVEEFNKDYRFRNIKFAFINKIPICNLSIDSESLKYVFFNIFLNSAEAYELNNLINHNPRIIIETKIEHTHLLILISDTAGGISSKKIKRVFEFGYTTKEGGTGMGLPSIKSVIESRKGSISINSINNATTATIRLPIL